MWLAQVLRRKGGEPGAENRTRRTLRALLSHARLAAALRVSLCRSSLLLLQLASRSAASPASGKTQVRVRQTASMEECDYRIRGEEEQQEGPDGGVMH